MVWYVSVVQKMTEWRPVKIGTLIGPLLPYNASYVKMEENRPPLIFSCDLKNGMVRFCSPKNDQMATSQNRYFNWAVSKK